MEERAKTFTERGKRQPDWAFLSVLRFAEAQKERVANGEISPTSLRNYIKAVKLLRNERHCSSIEENHPWAAKS